MAVILSDELLARTHLSEQELRDELLARTHLSEQELRTELAVWLYQTGRLSMGKAAEVAELPKFEFQHLLAERQIPISYGPEQFAQDVETVVDTPFVQTAGNA